uniref:185/333 n=1 Tax=Heliocidaris erythrogramma TaxID=7634 RepID=I3W7Z6_HELER|nr:185/333 [Heliocidaris erythrogramma]
MELKVTLIVALVTAITISVHAQRARGGRRNGRESGRWDENECEEEEHLPTESMTTPAVPDVVEIDINIIPEV